MVQYKTRSEQIPSDDPCVICGAPTTITVYRIAGRSGEHSRVQRRTCSPACRRAASAAGGRGYAPPKGKPVPRVPRGDLHADLVPLLVRRAETGTYVPREEPGALADLPLTDGERPRTRGDCASVPRPCPYVGCRHNTYLEVTPEGTIRLRTPEIPPDEADPYGSCVLDIVERAGERTLEQVGDLMGLTRERIRQIETVGLHRAAAKARRTGALS